jgi:hypothetical protein
MSAQIAVGVLRADGRTAPEARFDVEYVANAVSYVAGLPLDTNVHFMTVMATLFRLSAGVSRRRVFL